MSNFFYDCLNFCDHIAVIDKNGVPFSYKQLHIDASQLSTKIMLSDRKSLLFIYAGNNYESLVAYIASFLSNSVCMLINQKTDPVLVDMLVKTYQPDFIWRPSVLPENQYFLEERQVERTTVIHPDVKLLVPTSGSTGSPKLVRLSAKNLNENAKSIVSYLELDNTERAITSLPIYYIYGLSIINSHLLVGATILLTDDDILTKSFWNFFEQFGATTIAGVPYSYEIFLKLKVLEQKLPSLRYMTQAGGKLSSKLVELFGRTLLERNQRFYVMYGQTEASPRMAYLPYDKCIEKPESIGIAVPGGRIYICDNDGNELHLSNVLGEIVYTGENVMMGYATSIDDLSSGDENQGVLLTGDIGYKDDDGYIYITGRSSRFIKINGHRFGLDEIEIYLRNEGIDSVVGGKDNQLEIVITDETHTEFVKNTICTKFRLHFSLVSVRYIETIPRNNSGKPLYKEIFG